MGHMIYALPIAKTTAKLGSVIFFQFTGDNLNLKDIVDALKAVTDWFEFGTHLGVHHAKLLAIGKNYSKDGPERCKTEMLIVWMNQEPPLWAKILKALIKIGMGNVAQDIAKSRSK